MSFNHVKVCLVCFRESPFKDFPQTMHVAEHDICKICVEQHLETRILKEALTVIPCPAESCSAHLEYDVVKAYAKEKVFNE